LCELERIDRECRNVEWRIRLARFPQTKSFDTFNFAAQPPEEIDARIFA
jgi:DNA replication protein DnaC